MVSRRFWWSLVVLGGTTLGGGPALADDWPQWRGPQRDGVWRETGIVDSIPEKGLPVVWRTPIHGGYSGPAVAEGRVFVTDYVRQEGDAANDPGKRAELKGLERVVCLDAATGKILWTREDEVPYRISYPAGPRTTPAIDGPYVYTLGAEGLLLCLEADTGNLVWKRDLKADYKTDAPIWGFSGHPLVDGDKLICLVGGEGSVVVAFDKRTGRELWKGISASEPGYAPPTLITHAGVRQLLIWDADKLNSLNPETGKLYWSKPLKPSYGMSIMAPQVEGDLLFASGIGKVGAVFRLFDDKPGAELVWTGSAKNAIYCANSTPRLGDGVIYGVDCDTGMLMAASLKDGDRLWQTAEPTSRTPRGRHGTAFLVRHDDRDFLFSETGDLILARLSPEKYEELGRFHLLDATGECFGREVVWSHPAFANRCVFARNDREIVCVSLAK